MRISDWSSDLCSSDLVASEIFDMSWFADKALFLIRKNNLGFSVPDGCIAVAECHPYEGKEDRKSVVSGKSVAVRVDLGGRRIINNTHPTHPHTTPPPPPNHTTPPPPPPPPPPP